MGRRMALLSGVGLERSMRERRVTLAEAEQEAVLSLVGQEAAAACC